MPAIDRFLEAIAREQIDRFRPSLAGGVRRWDDVALRKQQTLAPGPTV
jgi:hypothetical protein